MPTGIYKRSKEIGIKIKNTHRIKNNGSYFSKESIDKIKQKRKLQVEIIGLNIFTKSRVLTGYPNA